MVEDGQNPEKLFYDFRRDLTKPENWADAPRLIQTRFEDIELRLEGMDLGWSYLSRSIAEAEHRLNWLRGRLEMLIDDIFDRLKCVETAVLPNLDHDLKEIRKILGDWPTGTDALDWRVQDWKAPDWKRFKKNQ